MQAEPPRRLYTFDEAAAILAVPASTLRRKARENLVPHRRVFKHVRFSESDIEAIQELRGPRARTTGHPGRQA